MKQGPVLVTGASGYLGSLLSEGLYLSGREVIGLDKKAPREIPPGRNAGLTIVSDITRPATLPEDIRKASVLVHCAALVHRGSKDLSRANYFLVNSQGTKNLLQALDPSKLRRIILLSTVSVYGFLEKGRVPDEKALPEPADFYGESKLAAEETVRTFSMEHNISYTILRLAPVYGRAFLLNLEKRTCLPRRLAFYRIGNGNQRLSLCAAGNVVHAVIEMLTRDIGKNETFNLKDQADYSINEIIDIMKRFINRAHRPVIKLPAVIPLSVATGIRIAIPEKGRSLIYQLNKVISDNICSGHKLLAAGVNPPFDLAKELLGHPAR